MHALTTSEFISSLVSCLYIDRLSYSVHLFLAWKIPFGVFDLFPYSYLFDNMNKDALQRREGMCRRSTLHVVSKTCELSKLTS
ncbi:unnamed protein product [Calypogeia fissa]